MEDIKLKDCEVINLKSNDVIIYKSNKNKKDVSEYEMNEWIQRLKDIFPKNKIIMMWNGDTIQVARNKKIK
jgi:hypothetical protein